MVEFSTEAVKEWWDAYIQAIRAGEDQPHRAVMDLASPCQAEVFWLADQIEGQVTIITHDRDRPDREIIINGPFDGHHFVEKVAQISQEERWQQPIPSPHNRIPGRGPPTKADSLANVISRFVHRIQDSIFADYSDLQRPFLASRRLWDTSSSHLCIGNVAENDIEELLSEDESPDETLESDSDAESESDTGDSERETEEEKIGGGGFIYEPVWVDSAPERAFDERVWGSSWRENEIVLQDEILENEFIAFRDGLLFILSEDGDRILRILNTFFGIGIFERYFQWRSLQPRELVSGRVGSDGITSSSAETTTPSGRNRLISTDTRPPDYRRGLIRSEFIRELLRVTETIYPKTGLRERITLHLQAHTHFLDDEYTASFLLNWIIIEQHLNDILDRNLRDNYGVNRARRQTIENGLNWFISHRIELAEITDAIGEEIYDELDEHRSKRNQVVHEMETVSLERAEDLDHLVSELLVREINTQLESTDVQPITHRPIPMKPATRRGDYNPRKWDMES